MNFNQIISRIEQAPTLSFGDLLNKCIDLFKKVWVQGLVTVLLNMLLAIPFVILIYVPLIFMGLLDASGRGYDPYYNEYAGSDINPMFIVLFIVIYICAMIGILTVSFGLQAAFNRICKLKDLDQMGREDYFYFFKKSYLFKTFKLTLLLVGISALAILCFILPIIYVLVPLALMTSVYAFNPDMSISNILKTSFKLGNKKWIITFFLAIIGGFLAGIVGFILCVVGMYFTASFKFLPYYMIYKEVVGFEDDEESFRVDDLTVVD